MAAITQQQETVSQLLSDVFGRMGSLKDASVKVIDHIRGEPTGNDKVAQLLEVFSTFSRGKKEIIIVTADLGLDSLETKSLMGDTGMLAQRFGEVSVTGLRVPLLPAIAEKMIDESNLNRTLQQGLLVIVGEDLKRGAVGIDEGVGGLRRLVNGYLNRELTTEWKQALVAKSPLHAAIQEMRNGLQKDTVAPHRAEFRKKEQPV